MKVIYNKETNLVVDFAQDGSELIGLKAHLDWVIAEGTINEQSEIVGSDIKIGDNIDTVTVNVSAKALKELKCSDCDGSLTRIIEELAYAVVALGGSISDEGMAKIDKRIANRDLL